MKTKGRNVPTQITERHLQAIDNAIENLIETINKHADRLMDFDIYLGRIAVHLRKPELLEKPVHFDIDGVHGMLIPPRAGEENESQQSNTAAE